MQEFFARAPAPATSLPLETPLSAGDGLCLGQGTARDCVDGLLRASSLVHRPCGGTCTCYAATRGGERFGDVSPATGDVRRSFWNQIGVTRYASGERLRLITGALYDGG